MRIAIRQIFCKLQESFQRQGITIQEISTWRFAVKKLKRQRRLVEEEISVDEKRMSRKEEQKTRTYGLEKSREERKQKCAWKNSRGDGSVIYKITITWLDRMPGDRHSHRENNCRCTHVRHVTLWFDDVMPLCGTRVLRDIILLGRIFLILRPMRLSFQNCSPITLKSFISLDFETRLSLNLYASNFSLICLPN